MALNPNWTLQNPSTNTFPIGSHIYRESMSSGAATFADNTSTATKIYFVDWDEQDTFLDDLFGYCYLTGSQLHRVVPDEHPDYKTYYCTDATVKPIGGTTEVDGYVSSWPVAMVTANYRPVPFRVLTDNQLGLLSEWNRFVSRIYTIRADFVTIPGYNYRFFGTYNGDGEQVTVATNPGFIQPSRVLKVTWHQIPAPTADPYKPPQEDKVALVQGKVNLDVIFGYQPGTLLFTEFEPKIIFPKFTDGSIFWDLTFTFEIRNFGFNAGYNEWMGHNYIFSTILGDYDLITADGSFTGPRLYQSGSFNSLFSFS